MAKKKEDGSVLTSSEVLSTFLKNNMEDHYNFEDDFEYKVSSGSLQLDIQLGGGFSPGLHRFCGINEGGKTSAALEVMKNFLRTVPNAKGFYIKAEGRLSNEMKERSGVPFTIKAEDWNVGTCFVFESNIYETVVDAMRNLVANNEEGIKYYFLLDLILI